MRKSFRQRKITVSILLNAIPKKAAEEIRLFYKQTVVGYAEKMTIELSKRCFT